jgi:tetratricopeptide (TPR) repeat protein
MKRHVALIFAGVIFLAVSAGAKTVERSNNGSDKGGAEGGMPTAWERPGLLKQITIYEEAARKGEAEHSPDRSLAKVYVGLASMYADLAMYPRAEEAMHRGITLLRRDAESKPGELAAAIEDLAMLHVTMGDLAKGEKEGREALKIRLKEGESAAIGASYRQLAALYLKRRAFKKSVEFGERAMDAVGDTPRVTPDDWIAVRYTLAKALCESGSCGRAIPLLQEAIEQAKVAYGEQSVPVGMGYYQLGYTYWRDGDIVDAARWLERGTALMKMELGWGHPTYINALRDYAKFLREHGTGEAAAVIEREVRQADAKVDVSTMTGMPAEGTSLR